MSIIFKLSVLILVLAIFGCTDHPSPKEVEQRQEAEAAAIAADAVGSADLPKPKLLVPARKKDSDKSLAFEEALAGITQCKFEDMYIDWETKRPANPYFIEHNSTRCEVDGDAGLAYFCMREDFHGVPVYQVEMPATTGAFSHGIYIDLPVAEARKILKRTLGSEFRESKQTAAGLAPALMPLKDEPRRSALLCIYPYSY